MTENESKTTFLEWLSEQKNVGTKTLESVDCILQNRYRALRSDPELEGLYPTRINHIFDLTLRGFNDSINSTGKVDKFRQTIEEKASQIGNPFGVAWLICYVDAFEEVFDIPYVSLAELQNRGKKLENVSAAAALNNTLLLQDVILSTLGHNTPTQPVPRLHDVHLELDALTREQYRKFVVEPTARAMEAGGEIAFADRQEFERSVIAAENADVLTNPQTPEQADNLLLRTLIHAGALPGELYGGRES